MTNDEVQAFRRRFMWTCQEGTVEEVDALIREVFDAGWHVGIDALHTVGDEE